MQNTILADLAEIDAEIMDSITGSDAEEYAKNLADFTNAQVFVGCTGCNGTQMSCTNTVM